GRAAGGGRRGDEGELLRRGGVREGDLRADLAALGRGARGEREGHRRAGDRQHRPVRRGLADPHQAHQPVGAGRTARLRGLPHRRRRIVSYLSLTAADREEMLAAIGVGSVDGLFRATPGGARFGREPDVPPALSEAELSRHLEELAAKNALDEVSFLGAGIYDHYVPAVVDAVLQRGEFLTAYTPYQPELSQGVL